MARRKLQLPLLPPGWTKLAFEMINPSRNAKRYYSIEIRRCSVGWAVITHRCRIGQTPRQLIEPCSTLEGARRLADKRVHDRLLHGYRVVSFE